eukprot:2875431-Pyramimonas_sp.AAC.1
MSPLGRGVLARTLTVVGLCPCFADEFQLLVVSWVQMRLAMFPGMQLRWRLGWHVTTPKLPSRAL